MTAPTYEDDKTIAATLMGGIETAIQSGDIHRISDCLHLDFISRNRGKVQSRDAFLNEVRSMFPFFRPISGKTTIDDVARDGTTIVFVARCDIESVYKVPLPGFAWVEKFVVQADETVRYRITLDGGRWRFREAEVLSQRQRGIRLRRGS